MAEIKVKKSASFARNQARRVVAQRKLEQQAALEHQRTEFLNGIVQQDVARMDRAISTSLIWALVLACLFVALGWFGTDIFEWAMKLVRPSA